MYSTSFNTKQPLPQPQAQRQLSFNDNQNRIKTQINLFVKQLNYQENNASVSLSSTNKSSNSIKKNSNVPNTLYSNNYAMRNYNSLNNHQRNNDINPNTIALSEKRHDHHKTQYKTMNQILKYDEIKSIKSSIYTMTDEDINSIPQEYINQLKDLANLINTILE